MTSMSVRTILGIKIMCLMGCLMVANVI